ncbi:MAG: SGNH/GDSL hydrolase family protein [Deltaproteobacteria bacterium]|nr:SGNH/GDSL hydrolase family protein [Deltaproteobacteria bacterium]
MKLLIRGGSIAAGRGVARNYVDILKESLGPRGIDVMNCSRDQETSFDCIGTFSEDIDSVKPDILVLHFGVDDAFGYVYRSEFQENLVGTIRLARLRFQPIIFLATSHMFDDPEDMDAVYIFYRSLRIMAGELDTNLIPVHVYWAGYVNDHHLVNADLVQGDTRYPNERGHRVIAEAMKPWFDRIR